MIKNFFHSPTFFTKELNSICLDISENDGMKQNNFK